MANEAQQITSGSPGAAGILRAAVKAAGLGAAVRIRKGTGCKAGQIDVQMKYGATDAQRAAVVAFLDSLDVVAMIGYSPSLWADTVASQGRHFAACTVSRFAL